MSYNQPAAHNPDICCFHRSALVSALMQVVISLLYYTFFSPLFFFFFPQERVAYNVNN